jgi:hypothetical protein
MGIQGNKEIIEWIDTYYMPCSPCDGSRPPYKRGRMLLEKKKPDLDHIYEMAIDIGRGRVFDVLIEQVIPVVRILKESGVRWYCFLFHTNRNGIFIFRLGNLYGRQAHFRFEFKGDIDKLKLPDYCVGLKKVKLDKISGINRSVLNGGDISEAWELIGKVSELVVDIIGAHDNYDDIGLRGNILMLEHFLENMTGTEGENGSRRWKVVKK